MKLLLPVIFVLFWHISFSQNNITKSTDSISTRMTSQTLKKDNGSERPFYKYIHDNFHKPNVSNFPRGKIIVKFTVKTDGSIGDIKILKDIGYGTANEIIRILENSPKWSPAEKDGIPVEFTYTLRVNISGSDDD